MTSVFCTAETLHWNNKEYVIVPKQVSYKVGKKIIITSDWYSTV
ncbi:hypothetical protein [Malaciobacter molluscorum]|nr:hypothetical protein [Malaciobacter molluscorum]